MTWVTMFLLRVALHLECVTVKRQKKKKKNAWVVRGNQRRAAFYIETGIYHFTVKSRQTDTLQ